MPPVSSKSNGKKRAVGNYCAVPGCSNYAAKTRGLGVSYHKFPSDVKLQNSWIKRIRRGGLWNPDKSFVCSVHFTDDDFERDFKAELLNLKKRKILKPGVTPSQNLPPQRSSVQEQDRTIPIAPENDDTEDELPPSKRLYSDHETQWPASPLETENILLSKNEEIVVFEFDSCDEHGDLDASSCWSEDTAKAVVEPQERPEDFPSYTIELPSPPSTKCTNDTEVESAASSVETHKVCERSKLRGEICKLRAELRIKEDSLLSLEQSSAERYVRIIGELTVENDRLKSELTEKNDKIAALEDALATDTLLKSIFSPDELERFLKKAKSWSEL